MNSFQPPTPAFNHHLGDSMDVQFGTPGLTCILNAVCVRHSDCQDNSARD